MQTFVILSALLAVAIAAPVEEAYVHLIEDANGFYKLKFDSQAISRDEERNHAGKVVGKYTYHDNEGVLHIVEYISGEDIGFRATGADIPVSVPEGHDIIHARHEHLAALEHERAIHPHGIEEERPVNVHEVLAKLTVPEIATLPSIAVPAESHEHHHVKAELHSAYAEALARLSEEYRRTA